MAHVLHVWAYVQMLVAGLSKCDGSQVRGCVEPFQTLESLREQSGNTALIGASSQSHKPAASTLPY